MALSSFDDVLSLIRPGARVGIVGSRDYPFPGLVDSFVAALPRGAVIVSGGNGNVDKAAASMGRLLRYVVDEFKADWGRYGRAAGPIRNREIVRSGVYCLVVFIDLAVKSDGSRNAIKAAKAAGVPVFIFDQKGKPVGLNVKRQPELFLYND